MMRRVLPEPDRRNSVLLLVALCAIANRSPAQTVDPLRQERLASDEEIAFVLPAAEPRWESALARPIRSLISDDYSDLEFLREALRGVRIVQLGESGHGMGETALLKSRLVRFLHRELNFDVVALESDLYQCADADRTAGDEEAVRTLYKCAFGVWHIEEVVTLFEHLRASRAGGERTLRLAGFDVQPIGRNKDHRPAFLAGLIGVANPTLAAKARATDSIFLARYADGSRARRAYMRQNRGAVLNEYQRFAEALAGIASEAARSDDSASAALRRAALVGAQTVRSVIAYIRQQTATDNRDYAEARNLGMAENVRFLADSLFPGHKIIVWAHNTHVRHASEAVPTNPKGGPRVRARDMGTWLREWYGEELYTVGFYAFRGRAVDNAREVYEIAEATPSHLEYRLARAGYRLAFVDLEEQGTWASREQTVRYNGRHDQRLIPDRQYDALMIIVDVSPPHFLY